MPGTAIFPAKVPRVPGFDPALCAALILSFICKLPLSFKKIPGVMFPIASKIHCWFFKKFEKARCARLQPNPDEIASEKFKTNIN